MENTVEEVVVASVDPVVVESLYFVIGGHVAVVLAALVAAIILFRFGKAFYEYIYTGEFSDTDDCFLYQLVEEHEINKHILTGTHPAMITLDGMILGVIAGVSQFLWAPLLGICGIVLIGFLLRQKIAKKQNFVAKLDGSHPDLRDNGFDSGTTQGPSATRTP